ncbi:MAG: M28 family metallopeptidase [Pseudomonadota bacterium]|uniref:Peptidase M28 n=1 Tax=Alteromonas alba TaxID=2079529 RepID=A0A2S9V418_9ALTE|nr:M28 family metallopeptidase [Alteromonas alba]MCP4865005.1 M28 family peptidase [Alteromonas sp.]MDY6926157.1 M28 family metallopeptidase [Pseudomonadota bacterium]PRO71198.1 peptidase M28 [Alteromonas alba]
MKKILLLPLVVSSVAWLSACSQEPAATTSTEQNNFDAVYNSITADKIAPPLKTLASDEFEGRLPTTAGEKKTLDFLVSEFKRLGLEPGNGDSYLQAVELMEITADPGMTMTIGNHTFDYKTDMVAGSKREQDVVTLTDSELVFVGYGINAPEYEWNDYEGLDVTGKTVVILVNDPGFENPEGGKFQGTTMTYYGRWSYKYEEASRQGAAGAIIVHETAPASYGWSVVANSWSGPQYGLVSPDKGASRVAVEGWLTLDAATRVFADAGLDFEEEKAKAMQGPYSVPLEQNMSVTVQNTYQASTSYNVLATLPGSEKPDEHVIYTSHWDHLGKDESLEGDQIYNGAHDNATGTAAALVMAEAFSKLTPAPKRSVSFLIVTAEEQGLLGSKYYADNPIIPLNKTVANINMDAMNVLGKTKDIAVIGMGKSDLEEELTIAATRQGRTVTQEDRPEAGYYYRSDHFSFAKVGVPALYAKGGSEPFDEETAKYRKRTSVIVTGCYHQVCDKFRDDWDLSGISQDTQLLMEVGYLVANKDSWPQWRETSEFQRK